MGDSDDDQIKNTKLYSNHPYDEAVDVHDQDEVPSYSPSPRTMGGNAGGSAGGNGHSRARGPETDSMHEDDDGSMASIGNNAEMIGARSAESIAAAAARAAQGQSNSMYGGQQQRPSAASSRGQRGDHASQQLSRQQELAMRRGQQNQQDDEDGDDDDDMEDDEDEDDDDGEEDGDDGEQQQFIGAYNPAKFENLQVSNDVKELFKFITRYQPTNIDLDSKLKCFIPNFIPSVGDIDAFIKVPRPDGKPDGLGLLVLDEPSSEQSDPTILHLKFRQLGKQAGSGDSAVEQQVRSIEHASKNVKLIDNWINSIRTLHRERPPTSVHYSRNMPDIDTLMQEWPSEFEHFLKECRLPTAELDCDLPTYVDLLCGLMDIPVSKSRVQSLHVLFSLYYEFKNSTHFRKLAEKQGGAV